MSLASRYLPTASVLRNSDFHNRRDGFTRCLVQLDVCRLLWADLLAMVDWRGCCVLCWALARSLAFRWPRSPQILPDLYKATCACACTPHTHMGRISNMPVILCVTVKHSHGGKESVSVFSDTVKSYLQTTSCIQYSIMKTRCTAVQSESQH